MNPATYGEQLAQHVGIEMLVERSLGLLQRAAVDANLSNEMVSWLAGRCGAFIVSARVLRVLDNDTADLLEEIVEAWEAHAKGAKL